MDNLPIWAPDARSIIAHAYDPTGGRTTGLAVVDVASGQAHIVSGAALLQPGAEQLNGDGSWQRLAP